MQTCSFIQGRSSNDYGQTEVPEPNTDFVDVAAGLHYSLGLKTDGTIVSWGFNDYGQTEVPEPNNGFIAIAAGGHRSFAIYGIPLIGDLDADKDIDLSDAAALISNLSGPDIEVAIGDLSRLDADHDLDLDLGDFAHLQSAFTGCDSGCS